jgi:hypothetical protein
MNEYRQGEKAAFTSMLRTCLRGLDVDDLAKAQAVWVLERQAVIVVLRRLCEEFGDDDWEDNDHLGDVLAKHLGDHLQANFGDEWGD